MEAVTSRARALWNRFFDRYTSGKAAVLFRGHITISRLTMIITRKYCGALN
jgi:hypothetical protein